MSGHHVLLQFLYKEDIFRQRICERSVVCLILHKHHKRLTKIRLLVLPAKLAAAKGMKKHALQFLHQIFPDERCTVWKKDSDAVRSAHHQA